MRVRHVCFCLSGIVPRSCCGELSGSREALMGLIPHLTAAVPFVILPHKVASRRDLAQRMVTLYGLLGLVLITLLGIVIAKKPIAVGETAGARAAQ
jgi:hypothetical protein